MSRLQIRRHSVSGPLAVERGLPSKMEGPLATWRRSKRAIDQHASVRLDPPAALIDVWLLALPHRQAKLNARWVIDRVAGHQKMDGRCSPSLHCEEAEGYFYVACGDTPAAGSALSRRSCEQVDEPDGAVAYQLYEMVIVNRAVVIVRPVRQTDFAAPVYAEHEVASIRPVQLVLDNMTDLFGMWKIVRGVIVIICRGLGHANPLSSACERPGIAVAWRSNPSRSSCSWDLSGGVGASLRDRPVVHEQHRARRAEPGSGFGGPYSGRTGALGRRTHGRSRVVAAGIRGVSRRDTAPGSRDDDRARIVRGLTRGLLP